MLTRQSKRAYLLISRYLPSCRSTHIPCQTNNGNAENEPVPGLEQGDSEMPRNSDELAQYLTKRIVAMSDYFVVLDKPPNLSVFGHSLAKQEALSLIDPKAIPLSNLCIHDCLPQLAQLLADKNLDLGYLASSTCLQPVSYQTSKRSKQLDNQLPSLSVIEPLPAAYSGLILLGRTPEYTQVGRQFYTTAMQGNPPWAMYQQFLALCWGQPARKCTHTSKFPIASYALNKHINIGYRPPDDEITRSRMKKGNVLYKRIQHNLLTQSQPHSSLIELSMNSTYRGLPEVYLLLEGCSILGETLQSSRLVHTGLVPVILHPSQTQLNAPLSSSIRQYLGTLKFKPQQMPIHFHRSGLFIPVPIFEKSSKTHLIKSYVSQPHGYLTNLGPAAAATDAAHTSPATDSSAVQVNDLPKSLSWSKIQTNPNSTAHVLTCRSLELPPYFRNSLDKLEMNFDYVKWISNQT